MITQLEMYIITRLTPLSNFLSFLMIINIIVLTIFLVMYITLHASELCDYLTDSDKVLFNISKSMVKKLTVSLIIISSLAFVTPTTKEAAAIIVVPKIVNNTSIQDCAKNLVETANSWMLELKDNCEEK